MTSNCHLDMCQRLHHNQIWKDLFLPAMYTLMLYICPQSPVSGPGDDVDEC